MSKKSYTLKTGKPNPSPKWSTGKALLNLGLAVGGGLLMIKACDKTASKTKKA